MHPLVAIVTPVYNGANYLTETMDCVQAQRYSNLVHVVLDNASNDDTPAILARYANSRVPVVVSRNSGVLPLVANWNAAVGLIPAEAKYFRVLSADDLIASDYVARVVEVAERHENVGVVGCLYHATHTLPVKSPWPEGREIFDGRWAIQRMFRGEAWLPSSHALYRVKDRVPGQPFYDGRILVCDLDATLRVLVRTDLGFIHSDLATTRIHATSHSENVVERYKINMCEWFYFIERYAPEAFGGLDYRGPQQLYRRYYLRQLLKWRFGANREIYERHVAKLAALDVRPPLWQFADALGDWVLVRTGLRPVWEGFY